MTKKINIYEFLLFKIYKEIKKRWGNVPSRTQKKKLFLFKNNNNSTHNAFFFVDLCVEMMMLAASNEQRERRQGECKTKSRKNSE